MKFKHSAIAAIAALSFVAQPVAAHHDQQHTDDQVAYVNNLPYRVNIPEPAMEAFRVVAAHRGWTPEQISSWEPAVLDIMSKESAFCWNVRRGARFATPRTGATCALSRQGRGSDAGFGQVTSVLRKITCRRAWVCSTAAAVSSPWASMSSLVTVIEELGVRPWCYNARARRYHAPACYHPGVDVP